MSKRKNTSKNSEPQPSVETSSTFGFHPSRAELYEMGKSLRDKCPRDFARGLATAGRSARPDRAPGGIEQGPHSAVDPGALRTHDADAFHLVSRRGAQHGRGPGQYAGERPARAGLRRRHLLNFGAYATPERRVIFDINDLDETLPAPWEWDVKRLAASFVLACRDNGFSEDCRPRRGADLRAFLPRTHGRIQRHADAGRVV